MHFAAPPLTALQKSSALLLLGIVSTALIFGFYVAFSPTKIQYSVENDTLAVTASLGFWDMGRTTQLSAITNVRPIKITTAARKMGTARSNFCQGTWRINDIDPAWVATTCVPAGVAIDVGSETWVLSPGDPSGFMGALQGGAGEFGAPPGKPMPGETGILMVLVVPIAFAAWLVARLSRPLSYRIEGGKLIIPAHFADVKLALAGATFKKEALGWGWRTAGTGMPGLLLGRFRFQGKKVQMAARDRENGVTVENGARTVYVTPADGAAFTRALVAAGATERASGITRSTKGSPVPRAE